MNGHDFLDLARDDARWRLAGRIAIAQSETVNLEMLGKLLHHLVIDALESDDWPTGLSDE